MHVVDVAVLYAELEHAGRGRRGGTSQADIARQYRKSAGYVSVLCRLGHALRGLPSDARDALRVRQVTFKAVQAIVSRHREPAAVLDALRVLAHDPLPERRRRRTGGADVWRTAVAVRPQDDPLDPLPPPCHAVDQDAFADAPAFVYQWDADLAARDPAAMLAAYETFVRDMTAAVVERLRRAAPGRQLWPRATPPSSRPEAPGSADMLPAPESGVGMAIPLELSVRQLNDRVGAMLRAHREQMAQFLAERQAARGARATGAGTVRSLLTRAGGPPGSVSPPHDVSPEEIEADLSDG